MKLVAKVRVGEKGHEGSDAIGTLHVAHFVPFENNHLGFFTIFDGDMREVLPGLRRQERRSSSTPSFPTSSVHRPRQ